MLERFQVPEADKVIVREERVRSATEAVFRKMGLGDSDAARAAEIMVLSDLRGHESHGVSNMLRRYVFDYGTGHINPDPHVRTLRESAVTATWDGDGGLGLQTGPRAMELAMAKAAEYGIGSVAVQNTRHLGMLAYYPLMAAKRDMIGVCMASAGGQLMVPIFGAEPRFGTHPMAWSAPARKMPPFVLDMATSQVAGNKLDLTRRIGSQLAPGWITKPDGTPIDEPVDVPEPGDFFMLPFGGTRERGGHKGYGIAVIVDIMSGILSGNRAGYFANDQLFPVRDGVQRRGLHGRGPVQGRHGRVDGDPCEHSARSGPRPRALRWAVGGRRGGTAEGKRHPVSPRGHRLVQRHQRRVGPRVPATLIVAAGG